MIKYIEDSINEAVKLFTEFAEDKSQLEFIKQISEVIADVFKTGNKVLICGNGGSATDAMHFAEECTGRFRKDRKALPVISLTDPSHITCVANDFGFDEVFSRGVEAYGQAGDLLIAISTSGKSENVIRACYKAKEQEMITFALLGKTGGKINDFCDYQLIVPGNTTDRIQEIHIAVLHIIVETIERILFPENY
ncbi:MAG: D-sedoheptulose 7-phosphate isomerase [Candidatus Cloacimonadota bacterium]|nr:MAG: D-sedoheptulose 7-phosphate isomerase [Candidatus Cloacimonadota bacterium]